MKHKVLCMVVICLMILSACNSGTIIPSKTKDSDNPQEDREEISQPDLSTEEGIREYLVGEWTFEQVYVNDVICTMHIDEDLNIDFAFYDLYADESRGDYSGQIKFDRIYANPNQAPDVISIELIDTDDPGGDFFFLHRTHYGGKFVMSWFNAGNGNCIFDRMASEDFAYAPAEIILEKENKGKSKLLPRKNEEFHAVYWGKGIDGQRLWIDDVQWTPPDQDDFEGDYPERMTLYQNDVVESTLYKIATDRISDILGDDLYPGQVYYVQTDDKGQIIDFISPE